MTLRRPLAFALSTLVTALSFVACSSSSGGDPTAASTGGGGSGGSGAAGSSGAAGAASAYTLDTVCAQIPSKICAARATCCMKEPTGYDAAGCQKHETTQCEANVAEVKAGTMTFDPTHIDDCLAKIQPVFDKCSLSLIDYASLVPTLAECNQIFAGKKATGDACERTAQCAQPSSPDAAAGCDDTSKLCTVTSFVGPAGACAFGSTGNASSFCKSGLYCDADLTKMPAAGTCKPATALGAPCDKAKAFDLECGLGSYCDGASGVCVAGKAVGSPCAAGLECASLQCDLVMGKNGTCGAQAPLVKPSECTGT